MTNPLGVFRTRCHSCGDREVLWKIRAADGNSAMWCEECCYQLRQSLKRSQVKDHMEPLVGGWNDYNKRRFLGAK